MQNPIPLSSVPAEVPAVVCSIQPGYLAAKLVEMGLCKGASVIIRFSAPFGGPLAVDLGSSVLSLRREEADMVWVELIDGGKD